MALEIDLFLFSFVARAKTNTELRIVPLLRITPNGIICKEKSYLLTHLFLHSITPLTIEVLEQCTIILDTHTHFICVSCFSLLIDVLEQTVFFKPTKLRTSI